MVQNVTTVASARPVNRVETATQGDVALSSSSNDAIAVNTSAQSDGPPPAAAAHVAQVLRSMQPPLLGQEDRLSIIKDDETGTFVYRSIDKVSGKVLNQWPAESMLQFKAYLRKVEGVLFDHKA